MFFAQRLVDLRKNDDYKVKFSANTNFGMFENVETLSY